jgi:ATPase subunit of ABC transporter with duplicated ATPase domains
VIRIRGLTLGRGPRTLLDSADAMIAPGERIALIGDNGSGKSTLLAAIAGDLSPDAGDIELVPLRIRPPRAGDAPQRPARLALRARCRRGPDARAGRARLGRIRR